MASHAGTTPMDRRRDAATAAAELALYLEKRAASVPNLVATVGMLDVPSGSINVVPGRCRFSLDIRATTNEVRDACVDDVLAELERICERRGLHFKLEETMRAAAAPSAPAWQQRWERAVEALGLPLFRMPSGAGHDAMKLHEVMPQAMLFVRGAERRHQPQPAGIDHQRRHRAVRARVPAPARTTGDGTAMTSRLRHDSTPGSTPTSTRRCASCRHWCACPPTRRRATTRRMPSAPPSCCRPSASRPRSTRCPPTRCKAYGLESITNLIVRRRYGAGRDRSRSNAHGDVVPPGEGWTHDPYGGEVVDGKLYGRASAVSKSDFATYTFAMRALESLKAPLKGGVELHFTYDEEFGGELGPGWLLSNGLTKPDLLIAAGFSYQVVTAHNGCLQMEVTVHGKMAHAAIPDTGVDALQAATQILNALYAPEHAATSRCTSQVPGITHPYLNVGPDRGRHQHQRRARQGGAQARPPHDPRGEPGRGRGRRCAGDRRRGGAQPGIRVEIKRLLLAHSLKPLPGNQPLVEALQRHGQAVFGEPIPASGTPLYTDVRLYGEQRHPGA